MKKSVVVVAAMMAVTMGLSMTAYAAQTNKTNKVKKVKVVNTKDVVGADTYVGTYTKETPVSTYQATIAKNADGSYAVTVAAGEINDSGVAKLQGDNSLVVVSSNNGALAGGKFGTNGYTLAFFPKGAENNGVDVDAYEFTKTGASANTVTADTSAQKPTMTSGSGTSATANTAAASSTGIDGSYKFVSSPDGSLKGSIVQVKKTGDSTATVSLYDGAKYHYGEFKLTQNADGSTSLTVDTSKTTDELAKTFANFLFAGSKAILTTASNVAVNFAK